MGNGGDDAASDVKRWEAVADLFTAVAHPVRVAILESLLNDAERPLTEVADVFGYSRSAIQKHVETLETAEAVYRPEESGTTYALTPFGRYLATLLARDGEMLQTAMQRLEEAEDQAAEEFADVPLGESAMEKAVMERKWEVVEDDLVALLDVELPEMSDQDDG